MKKSILIAGGVVAVLAVLGAGLWLGAPLMNTLGLSLGSQSASLSPLPSLGLANSIPGNSGLAAPADADTNTGTGTKVGRAKAGLNLILQIERAEISTVSKTLNLTPSQILADLDSGMSMSQIEQAQGVSQSTLVSAMAQTARQQLQGFVNAGKLSQGQAQTLFNALSSAKFLDRLFILTNN